MSEIRSETPAVYTVRRAGESRCTVRASVNGAPREASVDAGASLAEWLRDGLNLTATHVACDVGQCGACTVLVNGEAVRACLMLAPQAEGAEVRTVEGLAGPGGMLHPLQRAFVREMALQCGYCTPGILMTLVEFIETAPRDFDPVAREAAIREALQGHACRCGGYSHMVRAALAACDAAHGGEST